MEMAGGGRGRLKAGQAAAGPSGALAGTAAGIGVTQAQNATRQDCPAVL